MKKKTTLVLFIIIAAVAFVFVCKNLFFKTAENDEESRRNVILNYLSDPMYTHEDFCKQLTGTDAELEMYDLDSGLLYFSIEKEKFDKETTFKKLTKNKNHIEIAKTEEGRLALGSYILYKKNHIFFRFPVNDFIIPKQLTFNIYYPEYTYSITEKELEDYLKNRSVYGGELRIFKSSEYSRSTYSFNHGAMVSIQGEPSVKRLVDKITKGCKTKEERVQKVLTFVTNEIQYDDDEANYSVEVLKRANEVLMTKKSDCSGKTILFASMLEQLDVDYRLAYLKNHICVLVAGNFPKVNSYNYIINEGKFYLAETTTKDFIIGETLLDNNITLNSMEVIQKVGKSSMLYNPKIKVEYRL